MFDKREKMNRNIHLTVLAILMAIWNCAVDIKQIPPPREIANSNLAIHNKTIYFGKFEVFTSDRVEYTKAWKYSFKSILKNNRVFADVKDLEDGSNKLLTDVYVLDVEVSPKYQTTYNMWKTWPAIWPMPGYWPLQSRTGEYQVVVAYTISQNNKIILQSEVKENRTETVDFYGFYRTSELESMIETANLKALDTCAKEISKNFP